MPEASDFLTQFGPIDRTIGDHAETLFSGDDFSRPHRVLWDLPAYFATHPIPEPEETVPLVIIGGGASGLFSAYQLSQYQPIVLEQAARLGHKGDMQGHHVRLREQLVDVDQAHTVGRGGVRADQWVAAQ